MRLIMLLFDANHFCAKYCPARLPGLPDRPARSTGTKSAVALTLVISPQGLIWHFCNRFFIGYWINNGALFLFSPFFQCSLSLREKGRLLSRKELNFAPFTKRKIGFTAKGIVMSFEQM